MIKTGAIQIVKSFSNKELKSFEDFINSPFHNKNKRVVQLFGLLEKFHPEYEDPSLTKEKLFEKIYGKSKYKDSYMRNLFSDLNLLAEKFLQYTHINENYSYEKLLIEELCRRHINDIAGKKLRLFEKEINKDKVRDQGYYQNKLFLYDAKSILNIDKSLTDSFRNDQFNSLIKSFIISIMETSFYLFLEEQRVNIKHSFDMLRTILDYVKNNMNEFRDSALLLIFYHLSMSMLEDDGEKYFIAARRLLKKNFNLLSKADKKNIYSILQTYCINKIDNGDFSYNRTLLDILMEMLKHKVTSHSNKDVINLNLYRNILMLCHSLNETQILQTLITKYLNLIDLENRKSISDYSNAYLNFQQKDFSSSLEYCNRIDFSKLLISTNDNLYFKNDIKRLSLMCLYELSYFESALSQIDAFRHFLRSSKIIKEKSRKRTFEFLNNVNELVRSRVNNDSYRLHKLKEKLLKRKDPMGNPWLLDKIIEIERRERNGRKENSTNNLI